MSDKNETVPDHEYEMRAELPSGQVIVVGVTTSIIDGSAVVFVDTEGEQGNLRIFVNDGDPVFDENPETGQYEGEGQE